jgi:dTDP-glucose pyrophosphorylase
MSIILIENQGGKNMWGIIPAAGAGSRIQPLAFSKELLPVGSRLDGNTERPRAVSEYLIERMIIGGAKKICFVISPGKSDIMEYYGAGIQPAHFCYTVQPHPKGLCDAIFSALPVIDISEPVIIGLPDTVWFPVEGLGYLPDDVLSFLLFPVEQPEFFDAVLYDEYGNVKKILVKQPNAESNWIWGAFKMPGKVLSDLYKLNGDTSKVYQVIECVKVDGKQMLGKITQMTLNESGKLVKVDYKE